MGNKLLSQDIVAFAQDVEDLCEGCSGKGCDVCRICESRLQDRLEEIDLGGRY